MRRGGRILIILGLLLGVITAVGTFMVLGNQPTTQGPPLHTVVVAVQRVSGRVEIVPDALGTVQWPEPIPQGAFEKTSDVSGKLAQQTIYPGQIILPEMLIDKSAIKGSVGNASLLVPEGKVAVSFGMTNVSGAAQAGDYVDMMLTLAPGVPPTQTTTAKTTTPTGNEGLSVTQMFLQDVLILQVGAWPAPGAEQGGGAAAGAITFALDRQDSLTVKSASEQGSIQLLLRRAGDHKPVTTEPVTLQYINKRFNFNLLPATTK